MVKKSDIEEIDGVFIIESKSFNDSRGQLLKPYVSSALKEYWEFTPLETWFTVSKKNVIRAMHMQVGRMPGRKVVSLVLGEIDDVLLDTRRESPTYGNTVKLKLDSDFGMVKLLCLPVGVAHGYRTHKDNTVVMYMSDVYHDAESDIGYNWQSLDVDWGIADPIISERDILLPPFEKK